MDISNNPIIKKFITWKYNRTLLQCCTFLIGILVVYDGFFGPQLAPKNLAGGIPWVHWRGYVILALLIVGNLFCMACPFMLPRKFAKKILPAEFEFPLKSKWLAVLLLLVYFWAYEVFDLWGSPYWTAWVAVSYFVCAFVVDGFFKDASFCKYMCPIGQFHFVNALVSPFEISTKNKAICTQCKTKECITGRGETFIPLGKIRKKNEPIIQNGCELHLCQGEKKGNMDCTFCLDCIKACPHDNVGFMTRNPLSDIYVDGARSGVGRFLLRMDYAFLALAMVFAAYLNAFGMIPPVYKLEVWLAGVLGISSEGIIMALLFVVGIVLVPLALMLLLSYFTKRISHTKLTLKQLVSLFSFSLVPIGFTMWCAHYMFHFLTGALAILPTIQSFLDDFGITLLNSFEFRGLAEIVPVSWMNPLIFIMLITGFMASIYAIFKISEIHFENVKRKITVLWSSLLLVLLIVGIYILTQPMEMRGVVL